MGNLFHSEKVKTSIDFEKDSLEYLKDRIENSNKHINLNAFIRSLVYSLYGLDNSTRNALVKCLYTNNFETSKDDVFRFALIECIKMFNSDDVKQDIEKTEHIKSYEGSYFDRLDEAMAVLQSGVNKESKEYKQAVAVVSSCKIKGFDCLEDRKEINQEYE